MDKSGRPLVLYHGTKAGGFDTFDPAKMGEDEYGFFFTSSLDLANSYAGKKQGRVPDPVLDAFSQGVYRVYLKMERPFVHDAKGNNWAQVHAHQFPGVWGTKAVVGAVKATGKYDSVVFRNVQDFGPEKSEFDPHDVYVVFDPTQIKSATANAGTFAPADPSIVRNPRRRNPAKKPSQTDTPAFKRWFGASKVVDEQGQPLVVYHGTGSKFEAFNHWRPNFFSTEKAYAEMYADKGTTAKKKGFVLAVFLRMVRPFDTTTDPEAVKTYNKEFLAWFREVAGDAEADRLLPLKLGQGVSFTVADDVWAFLRERWEDGEHVFDGLLVDEGGFDEAWAQVSGTEVSSAAKFALVPLFPSQIKSATGNRGTFDPDDPSIVRNPRRRNPAKKPSQTDTPAFKRWFGASTVVDAKGKPLVVYHGTTAGGFDAFRPNYRKGEQLGFGIHFAGDRDFATKYAEDPTVARKGKTPKVYEVYLSIKRPLVADAIVSENTPEFALAKKLAGSKLLTHPNEYGVRMAYMQGAIDKTSAQRAETLIREAGYDGIIYEAVLATAAYAGGRRGLTRTGSSVSYIVFDPTQIKSATDNAGTFDLADASILRNPARRNNALQIDTPAFKRWFGASKVVDEQGQPLVVYHGTRTTGITAFLPDGGREGEWQGTLEKFRRARRNNEKFGYMGFRSGTFFGPAWVASAYAGEGESENVGVMYPVYIKAENPIYMESRTRAISGVDPTRTPDAFIIRDGGKIMEVAVIDPTQVKSATDNAGTFDPADMNIYRNPPRKAKPPTLAAAGLPEVWFHGTQKAFGKLKVQGGACIWLADKAGAMAYATPSYGRRSAIRLIEATLAPDTRVVDLADASDPAVRSFIHLDASVSNMRWHGREDVTDAEMADAIARWNARRTHYDAIEARPWAKAHFRKAGADALLVRDVAGWGGHAEMPSLCLLNAKKVVSERDVAPDLSLVRAENMPKHPNPRRRKNGALAPLVVGGVALAAGAVAFHGLRGSGGGSVAGWKRERLPASLGKGYRYTRTINGVEYEIEDEKDTDRISLRVGDRNERIHPPGTDWGSWPSVADAQRAAEQDARFMGGHSVKRVPEGGTSWQREPVEGGSDYYRTINGMAYRIEYRDPTPAANRRVRLYAGESGEPLDEPYSPRGDWPNLAAAKAAAEDDARRYAGRRKNGLLGAVGLLGLGFAGGAYLESEKPFVRRLRERSRVQAERLQRGVSAPAPKKRVPTAPMTDRMWLRERSPEGKGYSHLRTINGVAYEVWERIYSDGGKAIFLEAGDKRDRIYAPNGEEDGWVSVAAAKKAAEVDAKTRKNPRRRK